MGWLLAASRMSTAPPHTAASVGATARRRGQQALGCPVLAQACLSHMAVMPSPFATPETLDPLTGLVPTSISPLPSAAARRGAGVPVPVGHSFLLPSAGSSMISTAAGITTAAQPQAVVSWLQSWGRLAAVQECSNVAVDTNHVPAGQHVQPVQHAAATCPPRWAGATWTADASRQAALLSGQADVFGGGGSCGSRRQRGRQKAGQGLQAGRSGPLQLPSGSATTRSAAAADSTPAHLLPGHLRWPPG